ncbi:hypothetical protein [Rehaibacterium terrae]|uniref:Secreted protein n=1 Tax=Rehaibacterium terrae TaxID=1341696 RepID=A0A7W7XZ58_9GAMM|nr:hypothetical protein [Rehaibacterium terrae]MBB5015144.1 hypothetical protein [Rehaibacterium terrae]
MRRIALLAALLLPAAALPAQEFSSLEERMTGAEFKAAGLDKLSPEELAALNAWLRRELDAHGQRTAAQATQGLAPEVDRRGLIDSGASAGPIVSRILGEFRGWDGTNTVFELENGQVWQSTDPAARLAVRLHDPVVRISPGFMNAWFLSVDGYNARVRVKRIR